MAYTPPEDPTPQHCCTEDFASYTWTIANIIRTLSRNHFHEKNVSDAERKAKCKIPEVEERSCPRNLKPTKGGVCGA